MNKTVVKYLKLPFEFNKTLLQEDLKRIEDNSWVAHYNQADYSGTWTSIALFSKDGVSSSIYAAMDHSSLIATEVMEGCPYIGRVLETLLFEKTSVRLMRLSAGAVIKTHRDNALGYENGEFRLHIPIVTNAAINFIVGGERVVMNEGTCWYINANEEHSVTNHGTTDRIHLVVDGQRNEWTDELFFSLAHEDSFKAVEKQFSLQEQELMIAELKRMNTPTSLAIIDNLTRGVNTKDC